MADAEKKRSIAPPRFARFLQRLKAKLQSGRKERITLYMDMANYENARDRFPTPYDTLRLSEQVRGFLTAVYSWMGVGLAITAITAGSVASSPQLGASVTSTFFVAGIMFAALAPYATLTHRDLQGAGQFLFMGLIGIVLASLVNIFWQNDGLLFVISLIGVIVFTGLTACFMGHRRD